MAAFLATCVLFDFPIVFAQDTGIVEDASSPVIPTITSDGSTTCVVVPATASGGTAWGPVQAGYFYTFSASGLCSISTTCRDHPMTYCQFDADGNPQSGGANGCSARGGTQSAVACPSALCYSLVGKVDGCCIQLGTSGAFTAPASGMLQLYFNDDAFGDNTGSNTCCITPLLSGWGTTVNLVDAQGFQPQLDEAGNASLLTPITDTASNVYDSGGALTDGASLLVVQLPTGATGTCSHADWTVTVYGDPFYPHTAAVRGSLWHGSNTSLPPLPATLSDPGTISVTLGDGETALFYRPPPSWAFGNSTNMKDMEIQVLDQYSNLVGFTQFVLLKPPLVLIHGILSNRERWNNFQSVLTAQGIVVDLVSPFIDYSANNLSGFDVVYPVLPEAISNAVRSLRGQRVAATRLDVVAHSAGGLVARWYMTPASQRPTGDRIDPAMTLTTTHGSQVLPLKFKTKPIHDDARIEFRRADNFGAGDIRRLITLGTPHRGATLCRSAITFFNKVADHKSESRRHLRTGMSFMERIFHFYIIPLDDPANPSDPGMMVLDTAAFYDFDYGAGKISRVIDGLPSMPVPYAPIEGIAQPGDAGLSGDLIQDFLIDLATFGAGLAPIPSDTLPTNSDAIVPSGSAHNITCAYSNLVLLGRAHWELGSVPSDSELAPLLVNLLGPDESLYCAP